jgi:polyketide biosynthesis enoyl-CoA hydratase PksH
MMEYKTIKVETKLDERYIGITIDRAEANNAINPQLITELNIALDIAEQSSEIRTVVIKGNKDFFCSGMDFKEALLDSEKENERAFATGYCHLLKRLATIAKTTISVCEGKVLAGGVGIAAASDIVIASSGAIFSLSEIIWGLLPANVLPYLIRRSGFQSAYFMTLTTNKITAQEAKQIHLVDVLSDEPFRELNKLNRRLAHIHPETLGKMKSYFRQLWLINEEMEELAINTLVELKSDPFVQKNIKNYVENGKFPWE